MRRIALLLLTLAAATNVFAQDRAISADERKQAGAILAHLFDTIYVVPEKGAKVAEQIRANFASGKYDSATDARTLAVLVHEDLAAATHDRHVNLRYTGKDKDAPILTAAAWNARSLEQRSEPALTLQKGGNVTQVEILEGNVGYVRVRDFMEREQTHESFAGAMALLANTDAILVDVRNCPGGSVDALNYLASYFFDDTKRVLMHRYNRPANRSIESTTVDVPGKRMPSTDLYILTGRSASACESFAFTLQQWGRAKTVGEKTAGAGYNNTFVDLGAGLTLSISIGSAYHPKTKLGFEGTGVTPDIAIAMDRARDAALSAALRKLGKAAPAVIDPIADVRALEREWLDAYEKRDTDAMQRIVAEDFTIYFENGDSQTKAQLVAMIARNAGKPGPKFVTEDVVARAYGDTVVLTGRVINTTQKSASRYTDTYVRRNGRWQVVASHLGKVKE